MSENLKTIKELADELGVTKQRIQQIISKLPSDKLPNKQGNKYILNYKDTKNIKSILGKTANQQTTNQQTANQQTTNQQTTNQQTANQQTTNQQTANQQTTNQQTANQQTTNQQTTTRLVDYDIYLNTVYSSKEKDKQIEKLTNLLDQQQRLALQDKKLLEEYKTENDSLKALKMPSNAFEKTDGYNQSDNQEESLKKQIRALEEQLKEKDQELEKENSKKWYHFWK